MRVIGMTDIHGRTEFLKEIRPRLEAADLILVSGDITHFGGRKEVFSVISDLREINERIYVVHGNCDTQEVETFLNEEGINLHGRIIRLGDLSIAGAGGSLPCPGHTPNEYTEDEFENLFREMMVTRTDSPPFLFVCHQPPFQSICDFARNGMHVGSQAVRRFIRVLQPAVCLTGHIHEGVGIDFIGKTVVINPGPLHFGGYVELELNRSMTPIVRLMEGQEIIKEIG
jgi:hypothetical protein